MFEPGKVVGKAGVVRDFYSKDFAAYRRQSVYQFSTDSSDFEILLTVY